MIVGFRALLRRAAVRYQQFERHVLAGPVGRWSVRRRWAVLVAVPLLLACCCGGVVVVPLGWVVHETVKAGEGEASPEAAVTVYLMDLGFGHTAHDELPLFDDRHQDELVQQWQELRATMTAAAMGAPDDLTGRDLAAALPSDGYVTVTAEVSANWWDATGGAGALQSGAKRWTFTTRDDGGGWRISQVVLPLWCGAGGYVTSCNQTEPTPLPAESPSPSEDPLGSVRDMLRCGDRDPFRDWHSCPPQVTPS